MSMYALEHTLTSTLDDDNQKTIMDLTVSWIRTVLFQPLFTTDETIRAEQLEKIIDVVKNWAKDCYPAGRGLQLTPNTAVTTESQELSPHNNSSNRSSVSDGSIMVNHPASLSSSPIFTDDTPSGSVSSYAVSPNVGDSPNSPSNQRPDSAFRRTSVDQYNDIYDGNPDKALNLLNLHILTILRMSIDCPFDDVRRTFRKFLVDLTVMGVQVPAPIYPYPSYFIPAEDILTLRWSNNERQTPRSTTTSPTSSTDERISSHHSSTTSSPNTFIGRLPDEPVRRLIIDTFVDAGRISHFYRILSYFPSFMEKYRASFRKIVKDPGPVKIDERFYLGIMAASQHKCQYLVSLFKHDFIINNGDARWLEGLQYASEKIKSLARLNTILAHKPWELKSSHISELIKCKQNPNGHWKQSDVVHIILVLATFHSLSSFIMGCGIVPEYDTKGGSFVPKIFNSELFGNEESESSYGILNMDLDSSEKISSNMGAGLNITLSSDPNSINDDDDDNITQHNRSTTVEESIRDTSQLIERLKCNRESFTPANEEEETSALTNEEEESSAPANEEEELKDIDSKSKDTELEEMPKHNLPTNDTTVSSSSDPKTSSTSNTFTVPPIPYTHDKEDFSLFLDPTVEIPYSDFMADSPLFKLQEYCWEDHCVEMVSKPLPGIGELLDQEFSEIRDLTDYCLFRAYTKLNSSETTPFRQAIWFYVLRLFGLFKDENSCANFDYYLTNKFKSYIKKLCCKPEDITIKDWSEMGFEFSSEDKCHINLIVIEARKQAELVYGLWNVMKWRTGEETD